jgi:hypothetical protein
MKKIEIDRGLQSDLMRHFENILDSAIKKFDDDYYFIEKLKFDEDELSAFKEFLGILNQEEVR